MWMAEIYSLILLIYVIFLGFLSNYFLYRIDTKAMLRTQEENYPEQFIAERAYQHLKTLNDFGPKVVGSRANEILAVNYIHDQAQDIRKNSSNPNDIEIDWQISSGNSLMFQNYVNLQNIIVRVQGETDHAVMLNCHFDSVPGSPGASDDIVNCCTMLEIYRVLTKSPRKQKHTIIFLFNGSEENGLQAAHGFITQQKWRKDVKAYINLESTGSDGKETLFRTGPKHDWLIKMYRQSVPRPLGHVASEELYEFETIPSRTDFQIFRDYGEIPGLDFAYVKDGWRYHTRYDSIDYISMESVQHTGNNILALTKKIANSDELADPPEGTSAIYFDYLGLIFISYTATAGVVTNYIVSILAFLVPFMILTKFRMENIWFVIFETIISFVTMVVSIVLSTLACWGMAGIMNLLDNTMSWFNTTFISIGIYGSLALIVQIGTYHVMQVISEFWLSTKKHQKITKRHKVKISLNGVTLFWAILTIASTAMGLRSGCITMVICFGSLCTYLLTYLTCMIFSKTSSQSWIFMHVFGHSFLFLYICYCWLQIQQLYIPIAAKEYSSNPDLMIALINILLVTLGLSYFIPLTLFLRVRILLYTILGVIFVTSTILAFSSFGFPFSDDKIAPRLERFRTAHIKRNLYDTSGIAKWSSNDVIIYSWDRNAKRTLDKAFEGYDLKNTRDEDICKELYNCGSLRYKLDEHVYTISDIKAEPNIKPTKFNLIKSILNGNSVDIEFSLQLKTAVHFSMTIDDGLTIASASIVYQEVKQNGKVFFMSTITLGAKKDEPFIVKIILNGIPKSDIFARVTIVTEDATFDQGEITSEYEGILGKYPDYTFTYVYQVDSSSYEIGKL